MTQHETEYMMDPQGRPRFYGLYSGQVTSVKDPLKKNRIQVLVHGPTGVESHNWAPACLPITDSSYHPDHLPHTAAQVAAMLTTTSTTVTSGTGPSYPSGTHTHSVTIPALTVVAKDSTMQLNHAHTTTKSMVTKNVVASAPTSTTDTLETSAYTTASGLSAPGTTSSSTSLKTPEHTFHRTVPAVNQLVWVMFIAGDPDYPVWIGVQS
jgi:hypothetical protein